MTQPMITDVTLPGMPEPEPLWAVHVQGTDDIYALPSRRDAELMSELLDEMDAKYTARGLEFPQRNAKVVPWAGTAAEHAEALREAEES